jgi:c-di-GMP-binding flagellar brake protein YcgR
MSDTPAPDLAADLQSDRRLEDRHIVHWPLLLSWATPAGTQVAKGRSIEISFGGMRVAVEHNFAIGDKLSCRLSVHPWHGNSSMFDIDMTAKVVHCAYSSENDGFDVGLQFTGFAGDGKDRFSMVVKALQKGVSGVGKTVGHG